MTGCALAVRAVAKASHDTLRYGGELPVKASHDTLRHGGELPVKASHDTLRHGGELPVKRLRTTSCGERCVPVKRPRTNKLPHALMLQQTARIAIFDRSSVSERRTA